MQTGLTGDIKNTQVGRSVDVDALTGGWWRQRERTPLSCMRRRSRCPVNMVAEAPKATGMVYSITPELKDSTHRIFTLHIALHINERAVPQTLYVKTPITLKTFLNTLFSTTTAENSS